MIGNMSRARGEKGAKTSFRMIGDWTPNDMRMHSERYGVDPAMGRRDHRP